MSDNSPKWSAFISYASADRDKAEEILQSLELQGFTCWIAPRDVRAGHDYAEEIINGITQSRCLILVLSSAANDSTFVKREVERAVSKKKAVLPVRIEDVLPSPALELFVSTSHWVDAWQGSLADHSATLARNLADDRVLYETEDFSRRAVRRKQRPRWIATAITVVLIALAVGLTNKCSNSNIADDEQPLPERALGIKEYNAEQVAASGIKLNEVSEKDFQLRFHIDKSTSWMNISIDADPKLVELLNASTNGSYAIGDKPLKYFFLLDHPHIPDLKKIDKQTLAKSGKVRLQFKPHPSVDSTKVPTIGPLVYEIDFDQVVLEAYKECADKMEEWAKPLPGGGTQRWLLPVLVPVYAIIKTVHLGTDAEHLTETLPIKAPASLSDPSLHAYGVSHYGFAFAPVAKGSPTIAVQLEYIDGTKSEIRTFTTTASE